MTTQLYRHYGANGELLYVGISLSAINRLIGHKTAATWFPTIAKVEIEKFEDRQSAVKAEIKAIKEEQPLFNRQHISTPTPKAMTPTAYRAAIEQVGLTQVGASDFFEAARRTSPRWAQGEARTPGAVKKLLAVMINQGLSPEDVDRLVNQ